MTGLFLPLAFLLALFVFAVPSSQLKCYTGFKVFGGLGDESKECESQNDYCYNMTANSGSFMNVAKAGCSTFRCILARDTCQATEFQGVPVSFCCCSEDLCNGRQQ